MQPVENKDKRPEFLTIDDLQDGKGGSILLNVFHIVSVRYFFYGEPSQACLEIRMIDGSDIRITREKATSLWRALKQFLVRWEYWE